jgi:hypothetical protein
MAVGLAILTAYGSTTIDRNGLCGVFYNAIYRNTDLAERRYQALDFQSS